FRRDSPVAESNRAAGQRVYSQGETVVLKGTRLEGLHVVAAGRVCAYLRPEKDKEWIKVAELGAGQVFGEGAILSPETAASTIKSGSADTVVFVVPSSSFQALFEADPALQERISAL
ncbi:MAG: cyclic nucleotide-binding domain-containing protein, partial [Elusimicrobiota bacterium]